MMAKQSGGDTVPKERRGSEQDRALAPRDLIPRRDDHLDGSSVPS